MLLDEERDLLLRKVMPLGKVPRYDPEAQTLTLSDTPARRFMNDLSCLGKLKRSKFYASPEAYDPSYLGIGINEALSVIIQDDYSLYEMVTNVITSLDRTVHEKFGHAYEQAIVLFGHESLGEGLFPHIHARRSTPGPSTLSVFFQLSESYGRAKQPILSLYPKVSHESRVFRKGYTDHAVMQAYVNRHREERTDVEIFHRDTVVFSGDRVPHSLTYTSDLWMVLVYDHVDLYPTFQLSDEALFARYGYRS